MTLKLEGTGEISVVGGSVTIDGAEVIPAPAAPSTDDILVYDGSVWAAVNSETQTKSDLNATGNAPIYACRAWVNFDGTQPAANMVLGSGNISSITDTAVGDYQPNFSINMPDNAYSAVVGDQANTNGTWITFVEVFSQANNAVRLRGRPGAGGGGGFADHSLINLAVFR